MTDSMEFLSKPETNKNEIDKMMTCDLIDNNNNQVSDLTDVHVDVLMEVSKPTAGRSGAKVQLDIESTSAKENVS